MKNVFVFLVVLFISTALSQNQLEYFPHKMGDTWVYDFYDWIGYQKVKSTIISDSVDTNGHIYLTKTNQCLDYGTGPPGHSSLFDTCKYIIVDSNQVFSNREMLTTLGDTNGYFLKYKLNAGLGDIWVVGRQPLSNNQYQYDMARIASVYPDTLFGNPVMCKNIIYYGTQDTSDTSTIFSREISEIIASDFGVINCKVWWLSLTGYKIRGAIINGVAYGDTSGITSIKYEETELVRGFDLKQNYPNPFNSSTTITYYLEHGGSIQICVYDISGKMVAELIEGIHLPGTYKVIWNGKDLLGKEFSSGIYFYSLRYSNQTQTKRMLLIK